MDIHLKILTWFILTSLCNCTSTSNSNLEKNEGNVGDIQFDPTIDSPDFKLCNRNGVFPLYENGNIYKGEKLALFEEFNQEFNKLAIQINHEGYITIRFVINCKGEIGMIRHEVFDFDYNSQTIEKELLSQIKKIVLSLGDWPNLEDDNGNKLDYYQYVTLKVSNGKIEEILP